METDEQGRSRRCLDVRLRGTGLFHPACSELRGHARSRRRRPSGEMYSCKLFDKLPFFPGGNSNFQTFSLTCSIPSHMESLVNFSFLSQAAYFYTYPCKYTTFTVTFSIGPRLLLEKTFNNHQSRVSINPFPIL